MKNGGDKKLVLIKHQRQLSNSPNRHRKPRWVHLSVKYNHQLYKLLLCNRRPNSAIRTHDLFVAWGSSPCPPIVYFKIRIL
uniref:Uncharacterized protein n=2 Tax=unclassified Caudoviricetes TaxID=2788787 RepID=A0A8S5QKT5_9CAUD|nr:MAG TPA: hypothetical protein [Siphoviridae sp. ctVii20]DAE19397.1 MAG TPA: hypothetical protein [Siphoviridae sp. ctezl47]